MKRTFSIISLAILLTSPSFSLYGSGRKFSGAKVGRNSKRKSPNNEVRVLLSLLNSYKAQRKCEESGKDPSTTTNRLGITFTESFNFSVENTKNVLKKKTDEDIIQMIEKLKKEDSEKVLLQKILSLIPELELGHLFQAMEPIQVPAPQDTQITKAIEKIETADFPKAEDSDDDSDDLEMPTLKEISLPIHQEETNANMTASELLEREEVEELSSDDDEAQETPENEEEPLEVLPTLGDLKNTQSLLHNLFSQTNPPEYEKMSYVIGAWTSLSSATEGKAERRRLAALVNTKTLEASKCLIQILCVAQRSAPDAYQLLLRTKDFPYTKGQSNWGLFKIESDLTIADIKLEEDRFAELQEIAQSMPLRAAIKLQSLRRGFLARRNLEAEARLIAAAIKLQSLSRGNLARRSLETETRLRTAAVRKLQSFYRKKRTS